MTAPLSEAFAWSEACLACERVVADGVAVRLLWHDEAGNGALVVRFEPGAELSRDRPPAAWPLELFVLSGAVADDARTYGDGMFLHVPPGAGRPLRSPCGATVFAFVRGEHDPHMNGVLKYGG